VARRARRVHVRSGGRFGRGRRAGAGAGGGEEGEEGEEGPLTLPSDDTAVVGRSLHGGWHPPTRFAPATQSITVASAPALRPPRAAQEHTWHSYSLSIILPKQSHGQEALRGAVYHFPEFRKLPICTPLATPDSWPVVAALLETSHSNEESSEWLVLQHKNPNWKIQLGIDIEHNTVQRLCISPTKNALRI